MSFFIARKGGDAHVNEEKRIPNYYAIIPAEIRYDNRLKGNEKLLYGEITALCNREGYCYAGNKYFADLFEKDNNTISRWISHLERLGYITTEVFRNDKKQVIERRIYINTPYLQNCRYPPIQKSIYPIYKIVEDNNININKIDRLFSNILNNVVPISKDFTLQENNEFINLLERLEFICTKDLLRIYTEENIEKVKIITYCLKVMFKSNTKSLLSSAKRGMMIEIYDKCKNLEKQNIESDKKIKSFFEYYLRSITHELYKGI